MGDMLKSFVGSKKATFAAVLILAATAFVIADKMTIEQWEAFVKWIGSVFIGAQAVEDAFVKREEIKAKAGELRPKVTADDPR